jgi:uncharacterized membrane protein YagU involved in acid resistance
MGRRRQSSVLVDAVKGGLAGLFAGWVMNAVTSVLYDREDPSARSQEEDARGGKYSQEVAVLKVAHLLGRELRDDQVRRLGGWIHRGMGIGFGALYAVLRRRVSGLSLGDGLLFGLVFFLMVDELANPALGFTPGPRAFPWQSHVRGLAGHLTYAVTTETQLRLFDRALAAV